MYSSGDYLFTIDLNNNTTTDISGGIYFYITYTGDDSDLPFEDMLPPWPSNTAGTILQETYEYNIQGWLTGQKSDLFEMKLRYHDPKKFGTKASFTGNITEWEWTHKDFADDPETGDSTHEVDWDLGRIDYSNMYSKDFMVLANNGRDKYLIKAKVTFPFDFFTSGSNIDSKVYVMNIDTGEVSIAINDGVSILCPSGNYLFLYSCNNTMASDMKAWTSLYIIYPGDPDDLPIGGSDPMPDPERVDIDLGTMYYNNMISLSFMIPPNSGFSTRTVKVNLAFPFNFYPSCSNIDGDILVKNIVTGEERIVRNDQKIALPAGNYLFTFGFNNTTSEIKLGSCCLYITSPTNMSLDGITLGNMNWDYGTVYYNNSINYVFASPANSGYSSGNVKVKITFPFNLNVRYCSGDYYSCNCSVQVKNVDTGEVKSFGDDEKAILPAGNYSFTIGYNNMTSHDINAGASFNITYTGNAADLPLEDAIHPTTKVPVIQDAIAAYFKTTFNSDQMNAACSEYLSREYGISNWNDFQFLKDNQINPDYYIQDSDLYPNVKLYYFPDLGMQIGGYERHMMSYSLEEEYGLFFPVSMWDPMPNMIMPTHIDVRGVNLNDDDDDEISNVELYIPSEKSKTYTFAYDNLSRLKDTRRFEGSSFTSVDSFTEKCFDYDRNGNITALKRYGENSSLSHDFTYNYSGNQLASLGNTGDDQPGTHTYGYNANGNMTSDGLNGLELGYNFLNLIGEVSEDSTPKATYTWRADGVKLGVRNTDGTDGFEYVGSLVYRRTPSGLELESAAFGGGRIIASQGTTTTYTPNYFLTDHLGSTRVVVDANGTTQQRNDYYALGERWANAGGQVSDNRYLFSGKEDQFSLGLPYSDFGARQYDPILGRWHSADPLSEKYYPWSPYNYVLNNSINAIDPDGKLVIFINGMHGGSGGKTDYWNGFDNAVMKHLNDYNSRYYDGSAGGMMGLYVKSALMGLTFSSLNSSLRYRAGYSAGKRDVSSILEQLADEETIKVITHSMGAAYAKGFIQALIDMGVDPSLLAFEADFAPFQPKGQKANSEVDTYQFSHKNDKIARYSMMEGAIYQDSYDDPNQGGSLSSHQIQSFWNEISNLPTGTYDIINGQIVPRK